MPTSRGWAAFAAGVCLWVAARMVGSRDLHMLAAGIVVLPFLAALLVRWTPARFDVRRQLSATRVFSGSTVTVTLTLANQGRTTTSYALLEDRVPAALGKPVRLVVAGVPPGGRQSVSYSLGCRRRGRFMLGPLDVALSDPFGLARASVQIPSESELIVYPEVEELELSGLVSGASGSGESTSRHLYRSATEFYTMREYVTGDDLRRIHWPSVARTGELMIRQDESPRRSHAVIFLDTRVAALGDSGGPGLERAISTAAALTRAFSRAGFALTLATVDSSPASGDEESLMDALASIVPSRTQKMADAVARLRAAAPSEATLAVVSAPPSAAEASTLSRVGGGFGRKLAVFVYPFAPSSLSKEMEADLKHRATSASVSLQRAGWRTFVLRPDERLGHIWKKTETAKLQPAASSS